MKIAIILLAGLLTLSGFAHADSSQTYQVPKLNLVFEKDGTNISSIVAYCLTSESTQTDSKNHIMGNATIMVMIAKNIYVDLNSPYPENVIHIKLTDIIVDKQQLHPNVRTSEYDGMHKLNSWEAFIEPSDLLRINGVVMTVPEAKKALKDIPRYDVKINTNCF